MSNLIILRPQNLFYLFKSLDRLNGIGEKKFKLLEKKIGPNIINLLCYLPTKSINRFENTSLKNIDNGKIITTEVEVSEVNIPSYSNKTINNIIFFSFSLSVFSTSIDNRQIRGSPDTNNFS